MKRLFRTLTLVVLPLLAASCNTDYNFDNISLEMTVGDTEGIAIPIGSTGQITLSSLLEDTDLGVTEDGSYGFQYGDSFEYSASIGNIPLIRNIIPSIAPIERDMLGALNADIPTFSAKKSLDFPEGISGGVTITDAILGIVGNTFTMHHDPHTFENEFQVEVPAEVETLKEIIFGPNGEGSHIDLTFDLGGLADVCESCTIENFNIELPAGFTLAKEENAPANDYITIYNGEGSSTPNHFHIENYPLTGTSFSVNIVVKKIDLSDMKNEDGVVNIREDVTYDLDFSGTLKAGTVETISPSVSIVADDLEVYAASIVANEISHSVSFDQTISKNIVIPDIIERIDYLQVAKYNAGDQTPHFTLGLELEGSPISEISLSNVEILLPEFLDIEVPEGWNYDAGRLTTPSITLHNDEANNLLDISIKGIKSLPISRYEHSAISLNSTIGLSAEVGVEAGKEVTINTSSQALKLTPIVKLDDIEIVKVEGLVDLSLDELMAPQVIDLSDLTASLEGVEADLNIASPVITLSVENPIGVGIDANITIKAFKDDFMVNVLTSPTISIQPADGDTPTTTHIVINGAAPDSPDYQRVEIDGFAEILSILPDRIEVSISAATNKDKPHSIILKDSYNFKVDYSVNAAFKFDDKKDGTISYVTEINDVDLSTLADIDLTVESLVLNVASESTLPIDLSLDVEFLDEDGAPIECITSSTTGTIKGSADNSPAEGKCAITLSIEAPDGASPFAEVAKTRSLRCHLTGTTLAGGSLKPEQYITANLSLLLDKGITVDLGSLLPEEDTTPEPEAPEAE